MFASQNLDIKKLRSFVAIIDRGGVAHAAQALNQTQGALSQQIKKLEIALGDDLFERAGHTLELTEFGNKFQTHARRLLSLHDRIITEAMEPDISGKVTLGLPWDLINRLGVPALLRRFAEQNAHVDIALKCAATPDLQKGLASGDIDLALMQEHPDHQKGALLIPDRVVWVGAKNGLAKEKPELPLALTNPACSFRNYMVEALDHCGQKWRSAYETDSLELTLAMIRIDLAVGVLLRSAVPADLEVLPDSEKLPPLPQFNITIKTADNASAATHKLAQLIANSVKTAPLS